MSVHRLIILILFLVCCSCQNESNADGNDESFKGQIDNVDIFRNVIEACNVKNPLTDLPWLKEMVDGVEKDVEAGYKHHARIYQCAYKNGIGFLLEVCVDCPDAGYSFRNCEGVVLCGGGGITGEDNCPEFDIDFENKELIWELKKIAIKN